MQVIIVLVPSLRAVVRRCSSSHVEIGIASKGSAGVLMSAKLVGSYARSE
jgi:hypothetical protein